MAIGALALSLAPEIARFGFGVYQDITANKAGKQIERPKFEIPQASREALDRTRIQAGVRSMPGLDTGDSERLLADTVRGFKSIGVVETGDIARSAAQLKSEQGGQLAEFINGNTFRLVDALTGFGSLQAEAFGWNQQAKYQEEIAAVQNMSDAANQNIFSSLSNAATLGMEKMTQDSWMKFFDNYYDKPLTKPPLQAQNNNGLGIVMPENRGPGLGLSRTTDPAQEKPAITDAKITDDFVPNFGDFKSGLPDALGGQNFGVAQPQQGPQNKIGFDPMRFMKSIGMETVNPLNIF